MLLYEDTTRQIIGALYKVYNTLGFGYKEKDYQKALALELERIGLKFQRELYSNLKFNDKILAGFYVDFLIEEKIVLEMKVAKDFYLKFRQQTLQYLKNHNLRLGLIAIITPQRVQIKRIIN